MDVEEKLVCTKNGCEWLSSGICARRCKHKKLVRGSMLKWIPRAAPCEQCARKTTNRSCDRNCTRWRNWLRESWGGIRDAIG